ncbi:hypothetical protein [Mesonia mobilis]|uniref:DUF4369 domain-containing protein n=1 Tax=Mesonia mobilis TaxID=369791 RepID=A0ABQ3C0G1_9FLAO|nr:hypothetical protein [Mesonia mobilis]MBQ0737235.1 hypothetical protein [Aquimarina celericrescens]GGZ63466.1 hypothetical protein GCM10008088_26120 [Mesonia mobilis]
MKYIASILIILALTVSCKKDVNPVKVDPRPLGDINVVINSPKIKIDSLAIFSIDAKNKVIETTEFDTLKFNLTEPLNDIYKIEFFSEKHITPTQVWLDGEKTILNIQVDRFAKVKEVKNSPLHDHINQYSKKLEELYKDPVENNEKIDAYLLQQIDEYKNSPFAFSPAEVYYYKNKEDLQKLKKLDSLLNTVAKKFNNHKINIQPLVKKSIENF